MKNEKNSRKSVLAILFAVAMIASISVVISPVMANNNASLERPLLPTTPPAISLAPGYCPSSGGSHLYEYIQSVSYDRKSEETLTITVKIWIANPTGCVAGEPCPSYDASPEYINAWIDWNGDGVFASTERVLDKDLTGYLGINYYGTMSTSNEVTIPADAVSSTWMRVNLGWGYDPNDPCEESWTWGDVVDKEVKIITYKVGEIDAKADINILDNAGNPITDPIWMIDAAGNVIEDEPIADIKSGYFKIKATVYMFEDGVKSQKPNWAPTKVKCDWSIFSTLLPGTAAETSGSGEFSGWSGKFKVTVPQKVGQYYLFLKFTFYKDGNQIGSEQTTGPHKLYVTWDEPKEDVRPPKEIWLEKATEWASGATNEDEVASKINQAIHNTGWMYGYPGFGSPSGATCLASQYYDGYNHPEKWTTLVEGSASCTDCVGFSNTWQGLVKILGVSGNIIRRHGKEGFGFVTKVNSISPDGKQGNAHPAGVAQVDRWSFRMHQIGKRGISIWSQFYDPTFGNKYEEKDEFIEWHRTTNPDFWWDWADLTEGRKIRQLNLFGNYGWGDYEYYSPSALNPSNPDPNDGAVFTGNYAAYGIDRDGDGVYDFLAIDLEVNVTKAGSYSIGGVLKSDETVITWRDSRYPTIPLGYTLSALELGIKTITLIFSGEDIYNSGIDGVYTVDLAILDENGFVINRKSFDTPAYSYTEFGEIPARIEAITDYGEDIDGDGLFDYLTVETSINVRSPMDYSICGRLYSNEGDSLTSTMSSAFLENSGTIELNFDGPKIRKSEKGGPYVLAIVLEDENYNQIGYEEYNTLAYSYTDFSEPAQKFTGTYSDYGTDTDGDELYNYLTAEVEVKVTVPGTYTILGWLGDSSEESDIIWDSGDFYLDAGVQSMQLNFDGMAIYTHGTDGPYTLSYLALSDENGNLVDYRHDAYTTSAYSYTDFQKPEELLVALTGNYNDYATDIDGDGVFDYLTVDAEVMLANPGYCIIKARLMDINGEEIVWAENTAYLEANQPQIIQLNFDGAAIYSHGVNGPYYLRDVYIYHTGDPYQPDYVYDAHTTAPYSYTDLTILMCGDVNKDRTVNVVDVVLIYKRALDPGYPLDLPWAGDVNCDHNINVIDVVLVYKRALDPEYDLNCC